MASSVPTQALSLHGTSPAWSRARAETENKKSLRAAALFLFWLKSQIQKMLIPAAASTCNLLDFMAPFGASSRNNIKFEERHGKQNKIYRKFANEFVLLFIHRQFLLEDSHFPECLSCLENPQNLWFTTETVSFSLGYQRQYEKADD